MSDQKRHSLFLSTADTLSSWQQSDSYKEMQKNIQLIRASQVNVMKAFRRSVMSEEMQRGLRLMRAQQVRMAEIMAKAGEGMRKFKKHLPEQLQILAENGWFIQGDFTPLAAVFPVAHLFRSGQVDEGNREMCAHIKESLGEIEQILVREYPKRALILKRAFDAARAADYVTSIPLMLMQADGIGREILGSTVKRFSVTSRNEQFKKHIKAFIDVEAKDSIYTGEIYEVVLKSIPLTASEGDPALKPGVLNRNAILHGLDTEYYTELNALRAVSWIGYVSYFHKNPSKRLS